MRDLIKYSGLLIIFIGIIILVISFVNGITGNTGLITSLLFVITGFIVFLLTNRYYE